MPSWLPTSKPNITSGAVSRAADSAAQARPSEDMEALSSKTSGKGGPVTHRTAYSFSTRTGQCLPHTRYCRFNLEWLGKKAVDFARYVTQRDSRSRIARHHDNPQAW